MTLWQTHGRLSCEGDPGQGSAAHACESPVVRERRGLALRSARTAAPNPTAMARCSRWASLATSPAATCSLRGARQERLTRWTRAAAAQAARATSKTRSDSASGTMSTTPTSTQKRRNDGQATRALSQSPGRSVLPAQRPVRSSWANSEWTVQVESIRGTSRLIRRPPSSSSFSVRSDGAIGDGVVRGLLELILWLE